MGSKQLLEGLLVALVPSSLGLVAYAILREAHVWFYQRYSVAPEEVGLNQLRMLSSMFRFIHLWVWTVPGSPGTNMLVLLLIISVLVALWRRLLPRLRRRSRYINLMADGHPVLPGTSVAVLRLEVNPPDQDAPASDQPDDRHDRQGGCIATVATVAHPSAFWRTRPTDEEEAWTIFASRSHLRTT